MWQPRWESKPDTRLVGYDLVGLDGHVRGTVERTYRAKSTGELQRVFRASSHGKFIWESTDEGESAEHLVRYLTHNKS